MQARAYNGEFTPPDTETETDKNALCRIVVHNPLSFVHILLVSVLVSMSGSMNEP